MESLDRVFIASNALHVPELPIGYDEQNLRF